MNGVRINEAILFVAANIPKETPQTTEIMRVNDIREIVLKVNQGRFLISGYGRKLIISHAMTKRATSPMTNLIMYPLTSHSPA
jgi:hypothetical protein